MLLLVVEYGHVDVGWIVWSSIKQYMIKRYVDYEVVQIRIRVGVYLFFSESNSFMKSSVMIKYVEIPKIKCKMNGW